MKFLRRIRFAALRSRQTVRCFDNGWQVLRDIGRGADELQYRVDGVTVVAPNVPGARVPLYEVFAEDEYDLAWFAQGLGERPTFVDIGAHIGCFVVDVTRRLPDAWGQAFEPTPSTGEYLSRNVELNGLTERVRVRHEAAAANAGVLVMADNGVGSGHNGVLHLGADGANAIEVPSAPIAEVIDELDGIDLLKMDCEGGEYDIVLNTGAEHWRRVRRVVMEYHALPGHSIDEIAQHLETAGLPMVRRVRYDDGLGLAWFARDLG